MLNSPFHILAHIFAIWLILNALFLCVMCAVSE